jgi:hypothetical protein
VALTNASPIDWASTARTGKEWRRRKIRFLQVQVFSLTKGVSLNGVESDGRTIKLGRRSDEQPDPGPGPVAPVELSIHMSERLNALCPNAAYDAKPRTWLQQAEIAASINL